MRTPERPKRRTLIAALAGLSLVVVACGSEDSSDGSNTTEAIPADSETADTDTIDTDTIDTDAADTEVAATEPETAGTEGAEADTAHRVVSLSPTHTEIMFAIGAGDQLVAIDDNSNYPEKALDLPHELSGFEPNVEAIAAYEPDLVLIGGDFSGLGDQLADLGIESWDGPAATTFDDTYAQIEELGATTGHVAEAAELVSSMKTSIDEIVAGTPSPEAPLSYFHELGPELFTATSTTFIGEVYGLFGLENIADPLEADAGQYPQLSAETLVEANPELIFLADTKCCDESAETVAERDGFDTIAAVQNGNVIELDDDIASRWGPRIVDYIEVVSSAVEQATVPA